MILPTKSQKAERTASTEADTPFLTERARGLLASALAPRVDAENAVSLARVGRFELSQMLIIAGALLLICGGLMLGGGLILRASTPSQIAAVSTSEPIAWLFEHKSLPIEERSVFATTVTPEGVRIKLSLIHI